MQIAKLALAAGAIIVLLPATTSAADLGVYETQAAPSSGWSYRATSYGWLTWLDGDLTVRGRNFDVNATPSDVLESLDFAFMGTLEARRGPLSLFTDIVYADISGARDFVSSSGSSSAALSIDYKTATVEVGAAYEVARLPGVALSEPRGLALDLLAGARYWYQRSDVTLSLSGSPDLDGLDVRSDSLAIARSGSVEWVDPFIGIRLREALAGGGEAFLRGDIGGFGAGSQFSWQLIGAVNWHLCDHYGIAYDAYAGYRALSVDYEQGSGSTRYKYDVIEQGPVLGLTGRF
ncbi:MAG: hypothetical protein WC807_15010 [Hyphomicrobium sp.]|jgi:hypothetical protein